MRHGLVPQAPDRLHHLDQPPDQPDGGVKPHRLTPVRPGIMPHSFPIPSRWVILTDLGHLNSWADGMIQHGNDLPGPSLRGAKGVPEEPFRSRPAVRTLLLSLALIFGASGARAAIHREALWVVLQSCVVAQTTIGVPFPCLA